MLCLSYAVEHMKMRLTTLPCPPPVRRGHDAETVIGVFPAKHINFRILLTMRAD